MFLGSFEVFLIESPHKSYRIYEGFGFPGKGRIAILFCLFLYPLRSSDPPPIFCVAKTPRHAAEHGKGRGCWCSTFWLYCLFSFLLFSTGTFPIGRERIEMLFLIFFSTPSPCGHSPYIPFRNTEGERYASLCSRYRRY